MYTLDFETNKIEDNTPTSPAPVGLSIKFDSKPSQYLAFNHPSGNNCTKQDVADTLHEVWNSGAPILMHNAKFDYRICMEHFKLPALKKGRLNDTMILAYLYDPREVSFALKYLTDKYLDMPPVEQQNLKHYILTHVREAKESNWGAYIANAPGNIVAPYAEADTDRTYLLYRHLITMVHDK